MSCDHYNSYNCKKTKLGNQISNNAILLIIDLPHIGNRKCIKFVLHRNFLKMQCSTLNFLSRNLNGSTC
jgi:hypothetical protein